MGSFNSLLVPRPPGVSSASQGDLPGIQREQFQRAGQGYQPSAFPQRPSGIDQAAANEYYGQVHKHIMDVMGPMSPEAQREMGQMVAMSMPSMLAPGERVGLSAPSWNYVGARGEGGYAANPGEFIEKLANVGNTQWYQDIVNQRRLVESRPSPASILSQLEGNFRSAVEGVGESKYRMNPRLGSDINLKNPWAPKDGWFPAVSASSVENQFFPASNQTAPGQIAHSVIVGNAEFDTADYLETVRSRGRVEAHLTETFKGKPTLGGDDKQWQQKFGHEDARYAPELVEYLFTDDKSKLREPSQIDSSQEPNEDIRATLDWFKAASPETRKSFGEAVVHQAGWENLVQREALFLERQGRPLMSNWEKFSNDENVGIALENASNKDSIRSTLAERLGEQVHADVHSGQPVLLRPDELEALKKLHADLKLSTPFEELNEQQMGSLVQAAVYVWRHDKVLAAPADKKAKEEALRDKVVTAESLQGLVGNNGADVRVALQTVAEAMTDEQKAAIKNIAGLNYQMSYINRVFEVMKRQGENIEGYLGKAIGQSAE